MNAVEYPDYVSQDVIEEYQRVVTEADPATVEVIKRLVYRPCMEKVFRRMDKHFTGRSLRFGEHSVSVWAWFLGLASITDNAEWIRGEVKPARAEAQKRIERIRKCSKQLLEDLNWMCSGVIQGPEYHGLVVPGSFYYPEDIDLINDDANNWDANAAAGYSELGRISRKIVPETHYVRELAESLLVIARNPEAGFPSPESIGNKFVLSYDDLARVTRAALDLPDDPGPYRIAFSSEDVRRALNSTKEDSAS